MVREAQASLVLAGAKNAQASVMDAERLDFDDGSFDIVLCSFGIFFFPNPERAVAEFSRVLRPAGVVALSSWTEEDERWAWEDALLADVRVPRRAVNRPFDAPSDLEQLLSGAGLVGVRHQLERRAITFSSEQEWWNWKWSYSIRGVLEQMTEETRDEFRQSAFAHMQLLREPDGFPMQLTACIAVGHKPA
jgi:SAM-dependent methyltransferase